MQQLTTECPNCAVPLMLDDGTDQMPRAVYCEECQEEFPAVLARLDGAADEKLRLLPLLERCAGILSVSRATVQYQAEALSSVLIDLRRELGGEQNHETPSRGQRLEAALRVLARPLIDASSGSLEGPDIEDLLEKAGLIARETFSEDNSEQVNFLSSEGMYEIEDGDRFWRLTEFGKEFA